MSAPIRESKTVTEHRWFEYGRWFDGFGSSMDDHRHNENCEWRSRTVVTERWPWTDWIAGDTPHAAHLAAQRPTPAPTEES